MFTWTFLLVEGGGPWSSDTQMQLFVMVGCNHFHDSNEELNFIDNLFSTKLLEIVKYWAFFHSFVYGQIQACFFQVRNNKLKCYRLFFSFYFRFVEGNENILGFPLIFKLFSDSR
jgi:hypothetical protein